MYKEYYNSLNLRFQLFNAGAIIAFVASWMYTEKVLEGINRDLDLARREDQIGMVLIFVCLALSGVFHYLFHKSLMKIDRGIILEDRLELYASYYNTMILRLFALSIFVSMLYFFIQSQALIAAFAIVLVLTTVNRLTYVKIARQLKLNQEERDIFFASDDNA